jgi:tetratricopeptide (TPR) repeat protein
MKTFSFFCLFTFSITICCAQQKITAGDSLLLEYYQNQRFADAADYLKKTYPEPINDSKVLKSLAYTSQMASRLAEAEVYYQRVYNLDTTNTGVLLSLGSINLRRGNSSKADGYYLKYIAKDSSNFIVYKQLAIIGADKGDIIGMVSFLAKANKLNPSDPDVASELSDLYVSLKQNEAAEKALNWAITSDPDNLVLLESLVKLLYAQSKWNETIINGERLIQLGDLSPMILSKIGQAYYYIKNYQCGIETLKQIDNKAQNETTYYFTAACYKELNNQSKAIEYFLKTIDAGISQNIDAYYGEMADSYSRIKNNHKALLSYQKALEFAQKPLTLYAIANLYDTALKNRKSALRYYKKYLASKPPAKQHNYIAYSQGRISFLSN